MFDLTDSRGKNLQSRSNQNYWRNFRRKSIVGQLVIVLLGIELLFFGSFISVPLPTATSRNIENYMQVATADFVSQLPSHWRAQLTSRFPDLTQPTKAVRYSSYVPIVPLAVLTGYVLGVPLAPAAAICWVTLGLTGPGLGLFLFASGGGPDYWREPGFGYLLGMIIAAWFAGRIVPDERKSWRQLVGSTGGVLVAHIFGLCWLLGGSILIMLTEGDAVYYKYQPFLGEQIRNLSWYQLPYDFVLSFLLVALAFPLRWLTAILTAPDIANRNRNKGRELESISTEQHSVLVS